MTGTPLASLDLSFSEITDDGLRYLVVLDNLSLLTLPTPNLEDVASNSAAALALGLPAAPAYGSIASPTSLAANGTFPS